MLDLNIMNSQAITVITSDTPIAKQKPSTPEYQAGVFYNGTYQVYAVDSMSALKDMVITPLTKNQSLVLGIPKDGSKQGKMTTLKHKTTADAIARAKEDIDWNPFGNGYILIDIDGGDVPGMDLQTVDEVQDLLISYDSRLESVGMLILPSSSQKYDVNDKSYHVLISCKNMTQSSVTNYAKALQSIAWNKAQGSIKISKSGSLLIRQLFDMAVFSPERLVLESVFGSNPTVVFHHIEPLVQEGIPLNLSTPLKCDFRKSNQRIEQAKLKVLPEALKIRAEHKAKRIQTFVDSGMDEMDAVKSATMMYDEKRIAEDVVIIFNEEIDGKKEHTAGYVKVNPEAFTGMYCADPYSIEDGTQKAQVLSDGNIYSHKHGGYTIELMPSVDLIIDKVEKVFAPNSKDEQKLFIKTIKSLCSLSDIDKEEIQDIAQALKDKGYIKRLPEFKITRKSIYELGSNGMPLNTERNLEILLQKHYFNIGYDEILKEVSVVHPELNSRVDNIIDTSLSLISSYAEREGLPKTIAKDHMNAICLNKYAVNPLTAMVEEAMREYDGKDYIKEFVDALNVNASDGYKYEIFKRWGIEAISAWYHDKAVFKNPNAKLKFENVLVLLGAQGLNKTKLLSELLNFEEYDKYFKEGVKVNPSDKDSVKQAVSAGLVEIGELDATFRKADIADLKAFFSKTVDELRLPYDRASSRYRRRTVFAASVNAHFFLNDPTGNRRYWVFELLDIDFKKIDSMNMKMLWGQLGHMFFEGQKWWFDDKDVDDKNFLDEINLIHRRHQQTTSMDDYALELVQRLESATTPKIQMSPTRILELFGVKAPSKVQINEFKSALKNHDIEPNNSGSYYIPFSTAPVLDVNSQLVPPPELLAQ